VFAKLQRRGDSSQVQRIRHTAALETRPEPIVAVGNSYPAGHTHPLHRRNQLLAYEADDRANHFMRLILLELRSSVELPLCVPTYPRATGIEVPVVLGEAKLAGHHRRLGGRPTHEPARFHPAVAPGDGNEPVGVAATGHRRRGTFAPAIWRDGHRSQWITGTPTRVHSAACSAASRVRRQTDCLALNEGALDTLSRR